MPQSYYKLYFHFVWTTWNREPILIGDVQHNAYNLIREQCIKQSAEILALGGVADHVHLLVNLSPSARPIDLMQYVKGVTARKLNERLASEISGFKWQRGYGVQTVSPSHLSKVIRYIENQEQHHQSGHLWPDAEPVDEAPANDT